MRTGTYTSRMATRGSPLSTVCEKISAFLVTVARFFRVRGTVCAYSVLDLSAYGAGSFSRRTEILVRQGSDFFQFLAKSTHFRHRVNRLDPTQYACFHFFWLLSHISSWWYLWGYIHVNGTSRLSDLPRNASICASAHVCILASRLYSTN